MKNLKLTFAGLLFVVMAIITAAQINYEEAVRKARHVDTDGEILGILQEHGFQVGIYDEITETEKIKALFR